MSEPKSKSEELYERARNVLPSGVSYFIRYMDPPLIVEYADGCRVTDVDGNEYIDFWIGHNTHILGHRPPEVVEAIKKQIENGIHFGSVL